ncbi:Transmembrane protein 19 [Geranomyces michiganensis]|nr:Transmembrane protein 19 [Geranomyces michiganensis]
MNLLLALVLCSLLAAHGIRKGSLAPSGAFAAFAVGLVTFTGARDANMLFAGVLIAFYLLGSKATKFKQERKRQLEEDFRAGGQRTAIQVLANGLTGAATCALHVFLVPYPGQACFGDMTSSASRAHTLLILLYVGHYACCCGDTFASEIGILSAGEPVLITTGKRVPRGTNGGLSPLGVAASIAGGSVVGLVAAIGLPLAPMCASGLAPRVAIIAFGGLGGFLGSMIDSLLGATLQESIYNTVTAKIAPDGRTLRAGETPAQLRHISGRAVLDNHQVNFLSSLATGIILALVGLLCYS